MSRLHRQKLRLRSQQRADGVIDPEADDIDREAFQDVGTGPAGREEGAAVAQTEPPEDLPRDEQPPPAALPAQNPDDVDTSGTPKA